jgi:hypothetical protein
MRACVSTLNVREQQALPVARFGELLDRLAPCFGNAPKCRSSAPHG